jgi:hypothetical protein
MSFDLDAYRADVRPVEAADLDLEVFRDQPLDPGVLRCLRYMHDVESHTVCYLRDLLLTSGHKDPRITTFLSMWNYEEYWHGVALGQVLAAHGEAAGDDRIAPMRKRLGLQDSLGPFIGAAASAVIGRDFVALHMTWGAVNEWSTKAGYQRLAQRAGSPILTELLSRIVRQEARHIAFYSTEARERLAASARARRVTRFALNRLWAPVGTSVMPAEETTFLLDYLFDGPDGLAGAARIDGSIDRLPVLAGLGIVTRAVERQRALAAPTDRRPVAIRPQFA